MRHYRIISFLTMVGFSLSTVACGDDDPDLFEPSEETQSYLDQTDGYESWFVLSDADELMESGAHGFVRTYGNSKAEQAINDGTIPFPEGSIIAKEGFSSADGGDQQTFDIMAKRSDEEGDWYWIQTNAQGMVRSHEGRPIEGDVSMCSSCHAGVAATDYVFLSDYGLVAE